MIKNLPAIPGDRGLIPGSGRSPGEGNGNPLQYYCLGNPMDRRAWWATVHEVAELNMTKQQSIAEHSDQTAMLRMAAIDYTGR